MKLPLKLKFLLVLSSIIYSAVLSAQTINNPLESLGKGYDVFGKYADPTSVKERLLDNSKMDYISVNNINSKKIEKVYGRDFREISNQFAAKLNLGVEAFFFKAGIETSFEQKTNTQESMVYSSIVDISSQKEIRFDIEPSSAAEMKTLRSFVTPRAKERLNSKDYSPENIFRIYGTHYIFSYYVGGSARYNTITRKTEESTEETIAAAIEAEYKVFTGGASTQLSTVQKSIVSQTKKNLYAIGGHSEFLNDINDKQAYKDWVKGIPEKSALCGFVDNNSLRPVWELCDDPERRKELETYYKNVYIKKFPAPSAFIAPISPSAIKTKLLNNAFIMQVFGGHFTKKDALEYLTVDVKSGVNLHYGENLTNTVNLVSNNSTVDGVTFSVENGSRVLGVHRFDNSGKTGFIIVDPKGNIAMYNVVKSGNFYQTKKVDAGKNCYNALILEGDKKRFLVLQLGDGHLMGFSMAANDNQQAEYNALDLIKSFGGQYIQSMAKIGDINRDGIEDIYCTTQYGHFILSFDGTKFTVLKKFIKAELVANAFHVGKNDVVQTVGSLDGNKKVSVILYNENKQHVVLNPGNQTVVLGVNLIRDKLIGKFSINAHSDLLGYLDIDGDGKDEVIFGTDIGASRKYQIVDILNNTNPERVSHTVNY